MKTKVERIPRRPIYPTPAGLIVSVDARGKPNIITLGEIFNLSIGNPVWVGIAVRKATYSHGLIKGLGEFTVNMPTSAMLNEVLGCGMCSGRDGIDIRSLERLVEVMADFRPEAELVAVGKTGGGVDQHGAGVHFPDEALGIGVIGGNDRFRMV